MLGTRFPSPVSTFRDSPTGYAAQPRSAMIGPWDNIAGRREA
jgi:hypothetical protein